MDVFMNLMVGVLEQGLIYGILALGIYISYKILNIPDLSVDGTFPLGGSVCALALLNNVNPWLSLILASLVGALSGMLTGLIHVRLKISELLAGIIVMTSLYSVNLRMVGSSNVPLFNQQTIFDSPLAKIIPQPLGGFFLRVTFISLILVIIFKLLLDRLLVSRFGYVLRATGDNPRVVLSLGKDPGLYKIYGLGLANGLVALSGAILTQQQRVFDIGMGTGTMVIGIGSVVMGISIFGRFSFLKATTAAILGSIVYKLLISMALRLGLHTDFMKLAQGILFLIILLISKRKKGANHA